MARGPLREVVARSYDEGPHDEARDRSGVVEPAAVDDAPSARARARGEQGAVERVHTERGRGATDTCGQARNDAACGAEQRGSVL